MVGRVRTPILRVVVDGPERQPVPAPTPALDDSQLIEACRQGDPSAARALHARIRPVVDATIARLLGRKDTRFEDLAHIALIELIRSLTSFRGDCSLDTWSRRVTAHAVYKELRRRKLEHRIFVPDEVSDAPTRDEGDVAETRSILRRIRTHLAAMDHVKAWTVVLHDVGGYDLKEIAQITGASVAAAQSRLVRGRADLQERLEADPELVDVLPKVGRK